VQTTPPLLTWAADLSARVSRVVADVGAWRVLAVLLVVAAVGAAARTTRRRR
jgi:cyanate permease